MTFLLNLRHKVYQSALRLPVFLYFAWILFLRRIRRRSRADNQGSLDGMFRSTEVLSAYLNSSQSFFRYQYPQTLTETEGFMEFSQLAS